MQKEKTSILRSVRFWQILIGSLVVLALTVGILSGLREGVTVNPGETEDPTTQPSEETEATLPPPAENPYSPADFYYEGEFMVCAAGESALGVDVSTWQGSIDWPQVKAAGVEYAMIRVGYRSTDMGNLAPDERAQENYRGATAAGLRVGAYFFSQAITPEEAREEALYVLELTKDWDIQMPIVYDWEYVSETARTANMDVRTLTDCTKAFCQTVQDAGYKTMIYFNRDQSHKQMFLSELTDFGFWLAMYERAMDYPYQIDMWQYTNTGSVPGIDGYVDLNLYFTYE